MRSHAALMAFLLLLVLPPVTAAKEGPTNEALARQVEEQRRQIEALATAVEKAQGGSRGVKLGGYGELHYNNWNNDTTGVDTRKIDFHRFVLFIGYDFSDKVRFVSEVELEHALAGDGKPGEVELEQAYIEFDLPLQAHARTGLFLVPVGILNETHEPTTFYGVERNPVESNIIPTTWWEAGAGLGGQFGNSGFGYDLALHSGLKIDATTFAIRGGRQKVAEASAEDLAATLRLRFTGVPGLRLSTTAQYQEDVTQDPATDAADALLLEAHAVAEYGPFALRALYASWDFDSPAAEALERDRQDGWYGEGAYRVVPAFGFFARYSVWDTGGAGLTEARQVNSGFNYWPVPNVVLKLDVQTGSGAGDNDGFNLGVGYRF